MEIGSIFLILALLILVVIYISRPLLEPRKVSTGSTEQAISTLLAERDQVIASIQELDDDYNIGKIPAENYIAQRTSLMQNGAGVLRELDQYHMTPLSVTVEDRLEEAIQARRFTNDTVHSVSRRNGNAVPPVPDDDLEQRIASRRRSRQGKAGGFCPKCGRPVLGTDRFCPKCGAILAVPNP